MFLAGITAAVLHSPEPNITDATIEVITAHFIASIKVCKKLKYLFDYDFSPIQSVYIFDYLWFPLISEDILTAQAPQQTWKSQVTVIITQPAVRMMWDPLLQVSDLQMIEGLQLQFIYGKDLVNKWRLQ